MSDGQNAIASRLDELSARYSPQLVLGEVGKALIGSVMAYLSEVSRVLSSASMHDLEELPTDVLAGLALIDVSPGEAELGIVLDSLNLSEIERSNALAVWRQLRQMSPQSRSRLRQAVGLGRLHSHISADSLAKVEEELARQEVQLAAEERLLLENSSLFLDSLAAAIVNGTDVDGVLRAAAANQEVRDILDRLANAEYQLESTVPDDVRAAAARYATVVNRWRDVRYVLEGRPNHWIQTRSNISLDLDTGFPQVDLRIYSHASEVLHLKDDADDVIHLCQRILTRLVDAIAEATRHGYPLEPFFVDRIKATRDAILRDMERLSKSLNDFQSEEAES